MKYFLCLFSFVLPALLLAQTPFEGTWKTNFADSKLSQKLYEYSVIHGMYDCKSCAPEINVLADGQDHPVIGQTFDTIAVQVVNPNTIQLTGKKAGNLQFQTTRIASDDGQTLTSSTSVYSADGSLAYKAEGNYTRVSKGSAGSNATSGSWRVQNVNEDSAGLISTWKSTGDTLSMSTPAGISWQGKLDGKEYRVQGNSTRETVSLKRLGDSSLKLTIRRDGKIEWVETITVSTDGQKMTSVVDNKLAGRVSTYLADKQ